MYSNVKIIVVVHEHLHDEGLVSALLVHVRHCLVSSGVSQAHAEAGEPQQERTGPTHTCFGRLAHTLSRENYYL